jgi:hypothetical protein
MTLDHREVSLTRSSPSNQVVNGSDLMFDFTPINYVDNTRYIPHVVSLRGFKLSNNSCAGDAVAAILVSSIFYGRVNNNESLKELFFQGLGRFEDWFRSLPEDEALYSPGSVKERFLNILYGRLAHKKWRLKYGDFITASHTLAPIIYVADEVIPNFGLPINKCTILQTAQSVVSRCVNCSEESTSTERFIDSLTYSFSEEKACTISEYVALQSAQIQSDEYVEVCSLFNW